MNMQEEQEIKQQQQQEEIKEKFKNKLTLFGKEITTNIVIDLIPQQVPSWYISTYYEDDHGIDYSKRKYFDDEFPTLYEYNIHCHTNHVGQPLHPELSLIKLLDLEPRGNPWEPDTK